MERTHKTDPVILRSSPTVTGLEGNYRVVRFLGRGTMASVYLAEQLSMARPVALKILSPALASDPEFVERFLREARASARLNHPNIVSAIDFGEFDQRFFLAMEFVDGQPLSALLARGGALEEKQVIGIGLQVISALAHAADHKVIHLDVKPANIMICKDGTVKLADFGLAMILEHPGAAEASRKAVGTPYYMAPEQVEGGTLDWRSDQYSLGASLYEAVTGLKPFQGTSVSDILVKRFFEKPEPAWRVSGNKASRGFSAVLAKMLSRSPDGRYQAFDELRTDFNRLKSGKKPQYAKMHFSSAHTPSASAWDALSGQDMIRRVDRIIWRRRRNWIICAAVLFLFLLCGYIGVYGKELMGPRPHRHVRYDLVSEAENLPPGVGKTVGDSWRGAMALMIRAEKQPSVSSVRQAIFAFRRIAGNSGYTDTAYATAAKRRIASLDAELKTLEKEQERIARERELDEGAEEEDNM